MPVSKNSAIGSITLKKRSGPACLAPDEAEALLLSPRGPRYFILSGPLMTPRTERWKSVNTVMASDAYVLSYRLPAS